jgi:hypothetical protein
MKRSDAKIARQSSTSKIYIVIALSASAGVTSEAPSVVLERGPIRISRGDTSK